MDFLGSRQRPFQQPLAPFREAPPRGVPVYVMSPAFLALWAKKEYRSHIAGTALLQNALMRASQALVCNLQSLQT